VAEKVLGGWKDLVYGGDIQPPSPTPYDFYACD